MLLLITQTQLCYYNVSTLLFQGFVSAMRPSSSPESSNECNVVQNLSPPSNLSRSPTSQLIFTGGVPSPQPQKQENSMKSITGSNVGFYVKNFKLI